MKRILREMRIDCLFNHPWYPANKKLSLWDFYNRFNVESEKKDQASNVKKFFMRYTAPQIPTTPANMTLLTQLVQTSTRFQANIF